MSPDERQRLTDKLRKVEVLVKRGATPGERSAAAATAAKLRARLRGEAPPASATPAAATAKARAPRPAPAPPGDVVRPTPGDPPLKGGETVEWSDLRRGHLRSGIVHSVTRDVVVIEPGDGLRGGLYEIPCDRVRRRRRL